MIETKEYITVHYSTKWSLDIDALIEYLNEQRMDEAEDTQVKPFKKEDVVKVRYQETPGGPTIVFYMNDESSWNVPFGDEMEDMVDSLSYERLSRD